MKKYLKSVVLFFLIPATAIAMGSVVLERLWVKDIRDTGGGLNLTASTDEFAIRILAANAIVKQEQPLAPSGKAFLIIYTDKGSQVCVNQAFGGRCDLQEGTLRKPTRIALDKDDNESGGGRRGTCDQILSPYGHYEVTTVVQAGNIIGYSQDFVIEGYASIKSC
jgi:hypothetical protein